MSRRVQRLNEQLKREISQLLRTQVRDPRVLGVTVTGVEVAPDLTFARVWVQLSGAEELRQEALVGLANAAPFVRRQLGGVLAVRRVPELDFQEDRTLARAMRIEELLRETGAGRRAVAELEAREAEGQDVQEEEEEDVEEGAEEE